MKTRTLGFAAASFCLIAAVLAACAAQEATGTSEADYTRTGGVLGQAPTLKLGETKKGTINGGQIDVWAVDLREGDKITIEEHITRGTLAPDFGLFAGGYSHVASVSHDAQAKKLIKSYVANTGGKHYIGIAPYQGKGSGNYSVKVTCTGGPCAGEPFVATLEESDRNACIQKARACALSSARPSGGGNVTVAKAKAAWSACLGQVMTDDGKACTTACEGDSQYTCTAATKAVQYFAGKSKACEGVFNDCMVECTDIGDGSEVSESTCLEIGFNGTCGIYAKTRVECGGANQQNSSEDCHAHCESTRGAWVDDLDVMCEESCD